MVKSNPALQTVASYNVYNVANCFTDKDSAERLSKQVNDAVTLLTDYNQRLANELDSRKKIANMLRDFTQAQRELLAQAETRLVVIFNVIIQSYLMRNNCVIYRNIPTNYKRFTPSDRK